eukprot:1191075-Pyramimonas_sp.AAC.2
MSHCTCPQRVRSAPAAVRPVWRPEASGHDCARWPLVRHRRRLDPRTGHCILFAARVWNRGGNSI